ncbi:hypothetical protein [Corynebacterium halotolerans]|uniref:hypothetical protein n=1 Tax=Corynebacterium halotolerans TaxID=225326 RepID=UPI003CED3AB5
MASGERGTLARTLLTAWATLLLGLLVYPLFMPADSGIFSGQLALRDMMVIDHPALSRGALGFGDLAARNSPQDGLLTLIGMVMPASWFVRVLIVVAGAVGALGAAWLVRVIASGSASSRAVSSGAGGFGAERESVGEAAGSAADGDGAEGAGVGRGVVWGQAAAITVTLWNPFVVERFLQGHWSLVIAAWLLPLIAAAALRRSFVIQLLAMWLASLTPTGALFAVVVGVVSAREWRRRLVILGFGVLMSLPWIVPGLLMGSTSSSTGATAFAPRAEAWTGTLGSLLGLGGIWNADAVPASREAGFAVFGILLFAVLLLGARRVPVRLLVLGAVGLGSAALAWLLPGVMGWLISAVPGAGLLRDSQKLVMLAIPVYAAMAGGVVFAGSSRSVGVGVWGVGVSGASARSTGVLRTNVRPAAPAVLVILLAVLQIPDAPRVMQQLAPVEVPVDEELVERADGRDVLLMGAAPLTVIEGRVVVEPMSKALSLVESGALVVDGEVVDPPSERWVQAQEAWAAGDVSALEQLGVGLVVDGDQVVDTGAPTQRGWEYWLGLALLVAWVVVPVGIGTGRKPLYSLTL